MAKVTNVTGCPQSVPCSGVLAYNAYWHMEQAAILCLLTVTEDLQLSLELTPHTPVHVQM